MDIFNEIGIKKMINAHDTYTVYGGSRMAENTLESMKQISRHFVDLEELQRSLGKKIAEITHNEAAYITNGASGGILLCSCICMAKGDMYHYSKLPDTSGMANEIIVMRAQRNAYDKAMEASGAKVIEVGDADETLEFELEGCMSERTAAVFYFASALYERGSMKLEKTIEIAHNHKIPVVVDAAAQLPPVENLWNYTKMGADLVIFSGGKTLCGPQDSGLILGRKDLIEDCIRFGAPVHGICRSSKTSRESMAGLYTALKNYLTLDHEKNNADLLTRVRTIEEKLKDCHSILQMNIKDRGPVGQTYPRLFIALKAECKAEEVIKKLHDNGIYAGEDRHSNSIYISPLNLTDEEAEHVKEKLYELL